MPNPNQVREQVKASADALNRVLRSAGIESLDVRPNGTTVDVDGFARRRINAAIYAMPDSIARTVALSAWCVFAEVLAQSARGDMANLYVLAVHAAALTDHAHMIAGASAVQAVEAAMRHGMPQTPAARGQHHRP
jgi:hypothetical protein